LVADCKFLLHSEIGPQEILAESDAAWPLHSPKPAPRGLSVFDFGAVFSIPDKRSRGIEVLEGAYLPLRNPENPRN
jgi:hypothetical protein